jgi:A49-like RNA polymerase I associated factor
VHVRTKALTDRLQAHVLCVALAVDGCTLDFATLASDLRLDMKKVRSPRRLIRYSAERDSFCRVLRKVNGVWCCSAEIFLKHILCVALAVVS